MKSEIIVDTGPLVAFISEHDVYHDWVLQQVSNLPFPFLTCDAVITETCFLLHKRSDKEQVILEMVNKGLISLPFCLNDEIAVIQKLMAKYVNVPMSLADACLVRMTEQYPKSTVLTLDSDFLIYRRYGNQPIKTIMPYYH